VQDYGFRAFGIEGDTLIENIQMTMSVRKFSLSPMRTVRVCQKYV